MKSLLTCAALIGICAAACTGDDDHALQPPESGDAYLTIVGDKNVFMENGWQQAITVRYHDGDDHPLAGEIAFSLEGTGGGATLTSTRAVTDAHGEATVKVQAGATGDAAFAVEAAAEFADPVTWKVAVTTSQPDGPIDPTGNFRLDSSFDLVGGLPGTVGEVTRTFIDMTDSPYDPATWVLDQSVSAIGDSTTRGLINAARPTLDGLVNDALRAAAPHAFDKLVALGSDFGQVTRKLGTRSTLAITGGGDGWVADHKLTHAVFTIDASTTAYALTDLGMTEPTVSAVAVTRTDDRVTIAQHAFPLSYGSLLLAGLDKVVIPRLDSGATDLESYLQRVVPCDSIGATVAQRIGAGSPQLYAGACKIGVQRAAIALEDRILSLDSQALQLKIAGQARPQDTNGDRKLDLLQDGTWTGSMTYAGAPVTLGASTFHGERITN
ncbi:MAG TPA: hypothetical protein VHE35_25965 [Kofleriaceae bacterium]|nr:hypothetical protein [Kofleriaceae bacterium]